MSSIVRFPYTCNCISAHHEGIPAILFQIANMKKEIDAIRVKDISQGGLTQGQQTQIARNEQWISQVSSASCSLHLLIRAIHCSLGEQD